MPLHNIDDDNKDKTFRFINFVLLEMMTVPENDINVSIGVV